jgi:hypothetical protein
LRARKARRYERQRRLRQVAQLQRQRLPDQRRRARPPYFQVSLPLALPPRSPPVITAR